MSKADYSRREFLQRSAGIAGASLFGGSILLEPEPCHWGHSIAAKRSKGRAPVEWSRRKGKHPLFLHFSAKTHGANNQPCSCSNLLWRYLQLLRKLLMLVAIRP